jgi:hypothetical protein
MNYNKAIQDELNGIARKLTTQQVQELAERMSADPKRIQSDAK